MVPDEFTDKHEIAEMQRQAGLMVNRDMAEMWFEFFKLNDDCRQYCEERREGAAMDQATIPEGQTVASMDKLYCDWGDIHIYSYFGSWFDEEIGAADESYFAGAVPLRRGWYLFGSEKRNPEEMPFRQIDQSEVSSNPDKRYIEVDVGVSDVVLRKQFELWLKMAKVERENGNLYNSKNIARYQSRAANASSLRLRRVYEVYDLHNRSIAPADIARRFRDGGKYDFDRVEFASNLKKVQRDIANAPKIVAGTLRGVFPAA